MKEIIIDAKASAKKAEAHQATPEDTTEAVNYEQAFAGFGCTPGGLGAARESYYSAAFAEDAAPYRDTFIGIHHSQRGVRVAFQANTKTALIVLVVLIILLSHPGVLDLLLNVLKQAIGLH